MGLKFQKRLRLPEPFEKKLQTHMKKLKMRIAKKLAKYVASCDHIKLRKYEREMWAIIGMQEHNFEFQIVLDIYDRYVRLDLVPTHYYFPEFYRFWEINCRYCTLSQ